MSNFVNDSDVNNSSDNYNDDIPFRNVNSKNSFKNEILNKRNSSARLSVLSQAFGKSSARIKIKSNLSKKSGSTPKSIESKIEKS